MPIRFRCPGCGGLLRTAKRKAGAEVTCPKCSERLIVPEANVSATATDGEMGLFDSAPAGTQLVVSKPVKGSEFSFERPDFETMLEPAIRLAAESAELRATIPQKPSVPAPGSAVTNSLVQREIAPEFDLSRAAAIAVAIGLFLLFLSAFCVGVLVSR